MAHLIQPILIDEGRHCCDLTLKRTAAILAFDAAETLVPNKWRVYHAQAIGTPETNPGASSGGIVSGSVKFGICCASEIMLTLTGNVEVDGDDDIPLDWIEILHNNVRVPGAYYRVPYSDSDENPYGTQIIELGPFDIDLTDRPCGHIFEIRGDTGDSLKNNNVYWDLLISIKSSGEATPPSTYSFSNPLNSQYQPLI